MPYQIRKLPKKDEWRVTNKETGKIHALHTSLAKAKAQVRLLDMKGGSLTGKQTQKFVEASYKKKKDAHHVGNYTLDTSLSSKKNKVYVNPKGKVVVANAGTSSASDWLNNTQIPHGYKKTKRYKDIQATQKKAIAKYGLDNITNVAHSQSGHAVNVLAKKGLTENAIAVNPALIGTKAHKNVDVVRSSNDVVSALAKGKRKTVKAESFNPLTEHSADILKRDKNAIYGKGLSGGGGKRRRHPELYGWDEVIEGEPEDALDERMLDLPDDYIMTVKQLKTFFPELQSKIHLEKGFAQELNDAITESDEQGTPLSTKHEYDLKYIRMNQDRRERSVLRQGTPIRDIANLIPYLTEIEREKVLSHIHPAIIDELTEFVGIPVDTRIAQINAMRPERMLKMFRFLNADEKAQVVQGKDDAFMYHLQALQDPVTTVEDIIRRGPEHMKKMLPHLKHDHAVQVLQALQEMEALDEIEALEASHELEKLEALKESREMEGRGFSRKARGRKGMVLPSHYEDIQRDPIEAFGNPFGLGMRMFDHT